METLDYEKNGPTTRSSSRDSNPGNLDASQYAKEKPKPCSFRPTKTKIPLKHFLKW